MTGQSGCRANPVVLWQQFVYGLLRLTLLVHTLELIKIPHPDDINSILVRKGQSGDTGGGLEGLQELWRVFSLGDKVKVIADPFCGETGYVVAVHKVTIVMTVMQENRTSDNVKVSKLLIQSYLQEHMWSHSTEHEHANLPLPLLSKDEEEGVLPGDVAQDKGYNVVVGDIMEVARGKWYHCQGVVNMIDIPIKEQSDFRLFKFIGHDVWVIGGDKKGTHAMLQSIGRTTSSVAFFNQLIDLKNNQVATLTSLQLDGTVLSPPQLHALMSLHNQLFTTIAIPPCAATPPPTTGPSDTPLEAPWAITPDDITTPSEVLWSPDNVPQASTSKTNDSPDYSDIPWLFQPDFCDFTKIHLGFNVSVQFTLVSLSKCIIWTAYPNQFCGEDSPAPAGSVCVTVMGHNVGSGIQHLKIPAHFLTPANPTSKNQLCVVLRGPKAGSILHIKECQKKVQKVVTSKGNFPFSDICLTSEYNHGL
ncbi:hypothetical protein J3A83DRAFT_4194773 [Scleroderma citrinum]